MKKIVITGGAGFIGSHIVEAVVRTWPGARAVVLDKMTYAADIRNLLPLMAARNIELAVGDIIDLDTCERAVHKADLVIHAAAESHVDNSFGNSLEFTRTNVLGTHALMEACRQERVPRIIHVSTDEVYGEVVKGFVDEDAPLHPTNPYSASKAAAEMIISGYLQSYKMPIVTLRANNIYGIRQFPEKIIPKFTLALLMGRPLTLHGSGKNTRHYLSAPDLAEAILLLVEKGKIGACYNIGTREEYANVDMARRLCALFGLKPEDVITFVEDRPFNDARYALTWDRISALGWAPRRRLADDLPAIVQWYADNLERYEQKPAVRQPVKGAVA